jgi:hypothetical protein
MNRSCTVCSARLCQTLPGCQIGSAQQNASFPAVLRFDQCHHCCCLSCSTALESAVKQQLLQLFGSDSQTAGFQYAAAHLRLGGLGHEGHLKKDRGTGGGELVDTIAGLTCAQRLGQGAGLDSNRTPVLLITDNHMLRSFIISGELVSKIPAVSSPRA